MPDGNEFRHLKAAARRLQGEAGDLSQVQLRELLCRDCDFWHEEHEDELECSCYHLLAILLRQGTLTPANLAEAVTPDEADE